MLIQGYDKIIMEKEFSYIVFGSPSSIDLDVLVFVDKIPDVHIAKKLCVEYQNIMQPKFKKEVNVNIATIGKTILTGVLKGTVDEVNNSIIDTYLFHEQHHPCSIKTRMDRDVEQKILRTVRIILSNMSRTQHRDIIKTSLKNDNLITRLSSLKTIDLSKELITEKVRIEDLLKTIAFQMGQAYALLDGIELYTKEGVGDFFESLNPYLRREKNPDLNDLENFKKIFLERVEAYSIKMKKISEY